MRKYYKELDTSCGKKTPSEIGCLLGRLIGTVLLLGGGCCIGQIIRGSLRALGITLPGIF